MTLCCIKYCIYVSQYEIYDGILRLVTKKC